MSEQTNEGALQPNAAEEQKRADLARFDELLRGAQAENNTFEALKRKMASVVFRCGAKLTEAKSIAKRLEIGWYVKLKEFGIAESTARQAIKLYENATRAGCTAEDLENLSITEAKIEYDVIKSPEQIENERKLWMEEEANRREKERIRKEDGNQQEMRGIEIRLKEEPKVNPTEGTGDQEEPRVHPTEAGGGQVQKEAMFGKIELSELLAFRQKQLDEEALRRWNEARESPCEEDYLLFLFDLGVLWVVEGHVHYMPDQDEDRDELVATLVDKLTPVLERWTTADGLLKAFKGLVFAEAAKVEAETEDPRPQASSKGRDRIQPPKGG